WLRTAFQHVIGCLEASRPRVGLVGGSLRVAKTECGYSITMPPPDLKQDVSTDGNTDQGCTADSRNVQHSEQIRGMFSHGRGPVAYVGLSVASQVGKDQPITGRELLGHR